MAEGIFSPAADDERAAADRERKRQWYINGGKAKKDAAQKAWRAKQKAAKKPTK